MYLFFSFRSEFKFFVFAILSILVWLNSCVYLCICLFLIDFVSQIDFGMHLFLYFLSFHIFLWRVKLKKFKDILKKISYFVRILKSLFYEKFYYWKITWIFFIKLWIKISFSIYILITFVFFLKSISNKKFVFIKLSIKTGICFKNIFL